MEVISIFIFLAIVYFIFFSPKNPKVESKHLKTCSFKYMVIFVQHSERNPTIGHTQVVFYEHKIVFQGQINETCKIDKIERGQDGDFYMCLNKNNYPVVVADHIKTGEVHFFTSENTGYRFFS